MVTNQEPVFQSRDPLGNDVTGSRVWTGREA